jgi:hypothetical protein
VHAHPDFEEATGVGELADPSATASGGVAAASSPAVEAPSGGSLAASGDALVPESPCGGGEGAPPSGAVAPYWNAPMS